MKKKSFSILDLPGQVIGLTLMGMAANNYGVLHSLEYAIYNLETRKGRKLKFNPYQCLTLYDGPHLQEVLKIFIEKYKYNYFRTKKELKAIFTEIMKEVRGKKIKAALAIAHEMTVRNEKKKLLYS